MRPPKDETFLLMCRALSQQATCSRLRSGAVITNGLGVVVSTGYNGAPRGLPHCDDVGCHIHEGHCVRSMHAELNAILQAVASESSLARSTMYTLYRPCVRCALAIVQAGVRRVVYLHEYDSDDCREFVVQMFRQARVELEKWPAL